MSRPKSEKITRLNYCQYLLSSQTNYSFFGLVLEGQGTLWHDRFCSLVSPAKLIDAVTPNSNQII